MTTLASGATSITVGTVNATVGDTATFTTPLVPPTTGEVVAFTLYSNSACTTPATPPVSGTGAITGSGSNASFSTTWTPATARTYYWQASYAGDTNNNPAVSVCTDEAITVDPASTSMTTAASPTSVPVGTPTTVGDTATFTTPLVPPTTGEVVTFTLYSNSACTTPATPPVSGTGAITGSGSTASFSTTWTPTAMGTYYWQAAYTTDGNNLSATDCAGAGESVVVGPGPPDAPTITSVYDGPAPYSNNSLEVALTLGPSNGFPITSETVTCVSLTGGPAGVATGTTSPIFVGGPASGPYQCTITETNANGTSVPSAPFIVFLGGTGDCPTIPTTPAMLSTGPGNSSATVSWSPATGCVAGYLVTPYIGGAAQLPVLIPGPGTTTVMKGLTNGVAYTFTVAAENGRVLGPKSAMSGPITAGAPAVVTGLHVTRLRKGALKVAFNVPANNGAAITKYTATCRSINGGIAKATSSKAGPLTVTGLSAGKTYTCTVTATNKRGTGPTSHPSAPIKA